MESVHLPCELTPPSSSDSPMASEIPIVKEDSCKNTTPSKPEKDEANNEKSLDSLLEEFLAQHILVSSKDEGFFAVLSTDIRKEIWKNLDSNLTFSHASQVNWKWNKEVSKTWETWARNNNLLEDEEFWKKYRKTWKWILQTQVAFKPGKERNGRGTHYYLDEATGYNPPFSVYRGEWKKNKRHGLGKYVEFKTNKTYIGEWRDNKRHGSGVNKEGNGESYTGEFRNDKKEGYGVYTWITNDRYEGRFLDDRYHGYGVFVWANGAKYVGHWRYGMRNDKNGRFYWPSGEMFEGGFINNRREGFGKYVYQCGDIYVGQWLENNRHGEAVYSYKNGGRFEGKFFADERNGKGVYYWPDGDRYEGNWKYGARFGQGLLIRKNGERIIQDWVEPLHINYSNALADKYPQDSPHNVTV